MQTKKVFELNSTYMEVGGEEIENTENYRYKMLSANNIKGILPIEIRLINAEKKIYIDISGKESIADYYNAHDANRTEIKALFDAIFLITDEMSKFLINESDIYMNPEMVYKNMTTGKYEFVCIPLTGEYESLNEGMKELLNFLMAHLDNADRKLVEVIYAINDMYESGKPKFSLVYEYYLEMLKEEIPEPIPESPSEGLPDNDYKWYRPSFPEIAVAVMFITGLGLIGMNIYKSIL